jgi:hypothetical protein
MLLQEEQMEFESTPIPTSWDDLLEGIESAEQWREKRAAIGKRFDDLLRRDAEPALPRDLEVEVEREWHPRGFSVRYISYNVERDERARAYVGIPESLPDGAIPEGGFPGVVCLQGTTNWGARRTLGIPPHPDDPDAHKSPAGLDHARNLVRNGYVTISPEHFC